MPQEFHVVQCYNCHAYQVDIVKKVPKWTCKICNAKQSIVKVYSRGTGKDCRLHVQELNEKRITTDANICELATHSCVLENENQDHKMYIDNEQSNKWAQFMENNETVKEEEATCESFVEIRKSLYSDNMISKSRTPSDDQIASESQLETQIQYGSATSEQNTPAISLENEIQKQKLNVDDTGHNKWSKFMKKDETSEEHIAYESLLETTVSKQNLCVGSEENDKGQVDDLTLGLETEQLSAADENVESIISHQHSGEQDPYDALEEKYVSLRDNMKLNRAFIKNDSYVQKKEKDCFLKDINITDNKLFTGRAQCPLRKGKSKIAEIDVNDINSKRKKFPDNKNIFACDSEQNIESLLDI